MNNNSKRAQLYLWRVQPHNICELKTFFSLNESTLFEGRVDRNEFFDEHNGFAMPGSLHRKLEATLKWFQKFHIVSIKPLTLSDLKASWTLGFNFSIN
jgi:hypothetical protein